MTCILVQVKGSLSTVAATFLGFVARLADAVQASQGRPPAPQLPGFPMEMHNLLAPPPTPCPALGS